MWSTLYDLHLPTSSGPHVFLSITDEMAYIQAGDLPVSAILVTDQTIVRSTTDRCRCQLAFAAFAIITAIPVARVLMFLFVSIDDL